MNNNMKLSLEEATISVVNDRIKLMQDTLEGKLTKSDMELHTVMLNVVEAEIIKTNTHDYGKYRILHLMSLGMSNENYQELVDTGMALQNYLEQTGQLDKYYRAIGNQQSELDEHERAWQRANDPATYRNIKAEEGKKNKSYTSWIIAATLILIIIAAGGGEWILVVVFLVVGMAFAVLFKELILKALFGDD